MEPLRIHSNLLNGILEILKESFSSKIYAHRIIENQLKSKKKWGSRDRAFVAKHSYEMIRWWRLLWFLKGEESSLSKDKLNEIEVKWTKGVFYNTVISDLSDLKNVYYDVLVFFSPSGIESLFKNFPDFEQNNTRIAVFGKNTAKAATDAGLNINIEAPLPKVRSMSEALDLYIAKANKAKS